MSELRVTLKNIKPRLMLSQSPKKVLQSVWASFIPKKNNFKKLRTTFVPLMAIVFKRKHRIVPQVDIFQTIMKFLSVRIFQALFSHAKMCFVQLGAYPCLISEKSKIKDKCLLKYSETIPDTATTTSEEAVSVHDVGKIDNTLWTEIQEGYEMMYRDLGGEEKVLQMLEEEKKALAAKLFPKGEMKAKIVEAKYAEEHLKDIELK